MNTDTVAGIGDPGEIADRCEAGVTVPSYNN